MKLAIDKFTSFVHVTRMSESPINHWLHNKRRINSMIALNLRRIFLKSILPLHDKLDLAIE